jgi:hypothetical protein
MDKNSAALLLNECIPVHPMALSRIPPQGRMGDRQMAMEEMHLGEKQEGEEDPPGAEVDYGIQTVSNLNNMKT